MIKTSRQARVVLTSPMTNEDFDNPQNQGRLTLPGGQQAHLPSKLDNLKGGAPFIEKAGRDLYLKAKKGGGIHPAESLNPTVLEWAMHFAEESNDRRTYGILRDHQYSSSIRGSVQGQENLRPYGCSMITASKQIDRVANSLTHLAQSRLIPARDIKPLLVRLDRVANTLDQESQSSQKTADSRRQELMSVHHEDKVGAAEYFRENRKTPESLTAKDVADYLVIGIGAAKLILPQIQKMMQEKPGEQNPRDRDPQPNQMLGSRQTSKKKVAGQTRGS